MSEGGFIELPIITHDEAYEVHVRYKGTERMGLMFRSVEHSHSTEFDLSYEEMYLLGDKMMKISSAFMRNNP